MTTDLTSLTFHEGLTGSAGRISVEIAGVTYDLVPRDERMTPEDTNRSVHVTSGPVSARPIEALAIDRVTGYQRMEQTGGILELPLTLHVNVGDEAAKDVMAIAEWLDCRMVGLTKSEVRALGVALGAFQ